MKDKSKSGKGKQTTEPKPSPDKCQEYAKCLTDMFRSSAQPFAIGYPDGRLMAFNAAYCKLLGYSQSELKKLDWTTDLTPPEFRELVAKVTGEICRSGQPQQFEKEYIRKDGSRVPVQVFSHPILDASGNIQYYWSIFTDITERKQAEEAVRENQRKLSVLLGNLPGLVYRCANDPEWTMEYMSEGCFGLTGYTPAELMGSRVLSYNRVIEYEDRQKVWDVVQEAVAQNQLYMLEYRIRTKSGEQKWVWEKGGGIFTGTGELLALEGFIMDITERKQIDEALMTCEARWQFALEGAGDGVWDWNAQTNKVFFSRQWKEMLGFAEHEIGDTLDEWDKRVHPEDKAHVYAEIDKHFTGQTPFYSSEHHVLCKDGSYRWILDRGRIISRTENGEPLRVIGTHTDITKRRQAEEKLRRNEELLRLFVEHSPAAVAMFDRNMRYIMASRRYLTDYDLEDQSLVGRSHYEVFPEIPERWIEIHRRCLAGMVERAEEDPFPRLSGKLDWIRWEIRPWYESDGQIGGIILFSEVITERKQAEETLREKTEQLDRYFTEALDLLCIADTDGYFRRLNKEWETTLGYELSELEGKRFLDLVHPDDLNATMEAISQLEAQTAVFSFLNRYRCKDGSYRWIEWRSRPVGKLIYAVARDITDRKLAELALIESERKFRSIAEQTADLIAITDSVGVIIYASPISVKLFAAHPEEMIDHHFTEFLDELSIPIALDAFQKTIELGEKAFNIDLLMKRKDGSTFWGELTGSLFELQAAPGTLVVIRDITERRHAQERLLNVMNATVEAVARTLEIRDPYTAGHQQRVTRLACAIAKKMGSQEDGVEGLRMAGLVHDIGKIYVPAEILAKPGRLNEIEFSMIKVHPQAGYNILRDIEFPWPVAQIVLQHHERMDGSGYPQGLSGKDILPEAKILAVADVIEAMASHRPYRPAIGIDDALDEIRQNRGTLYDADAVDACIKLFLEKGFKFE